MGCYLSVPDDKVYVTEGKGRGYSYATASCQGWRREQEDAEDCLPAFDGDASLFVLCDGHGGAEVAKYTVEHFPDFIKNHPLYREGKYAEALETAFIDFDALLRTEDVMAELEKLSMEPDNSKEDGDDKGAEKPKEMAETTGQNSSSPKQSSSVDADQQPGTSTSNAVSDEPEQGSSSSSSSLKPSTKAPLTINQSLIEQMLKRYFPDDGEDDSSDDSDYDAERSNVEDGDDEDDDGGATKKAGKKLRRKKHRRPMSSESADEDTSTDDSEDDFDDEDDEDDDEDEDDDDDDVNQDEDEEDEQADESASSSDDSIDDDDKLEDGAFPLLAGRPGLRAHKPGMDSGCTVVVALLRDNKLYVASAGDSRCIMVLRNGDCKPMSFDHKPEDPAERKRIHKAGGRVTDGRVNGGLNLSRAFGDFTYKNADMDAKEQMITPCPDVKCADLDPAEVEYLFLACDGIWNSMKNQEVAKFIKKSAEETAENNLIEVCVSLFRNCIAPKTDGDGTGCDNMTCIIARFDDPNEVKSTASDLREEQAANSNNIGEVSAEKGAAQKRLIHDESSDKPTKRRCLRL